MICYCIIIDIAVICVSLHTCISHVLLTVLAASWRTGTILALSFNGHIFHLSSLHLYFTFTIFHHIYFNRALCPPTNYNTNTGVVGRYVWRNIYNYCKQQSLLNNASVMMPVASFIVSVETTGVQLVVDTEAASHPTINHQYATLMSLNQGETAVCGSSILAG